MQKIIIFITTLIFLLFSKTSFAQNDSLNVLIWKVTAGDKTSYFAGSINIFETKKEISKTAKELISQSEIFVGEADISNLSKEDFARFLYLPPEENIKVLLSEKNWDTLTRLTKPIGYNEYVTGLIKPWYLSTVLLFPKSGEAKGLDLFLIDFAKKKNVPVDFLELPEVQFSTFDTVSISETIEILNYNINNIEKERNEVRLLSEFYLKGDMENILPILFNREKMEKYPEFYQKLLINRNKRLINKIEMIISEKNAFFAIGLSNLLGDSGILNLLSEKGWQVEKIN